jgi:valyl-tRNA synthetase
MPYITEEIWQKVKPLVGKTGPSIMLEAYPEFAANRVDEQAESDLNWVRDVIEGVRNIRGEMNISPAKPIPLLFSKGQSADQAKLEANRSFLIKLAKLESVTWLPAGEEAPLSATALVGQMEVLVPMAGLIDKDAELARLTKELVKLNGEIKRFNGKLSNAKFVDNAPAEVVDKERAKLAEAEAAAATLQQQVAKIEAI